MCISRIEYVFLFYWDDRGKTWGFSKILIISENNDDDKIFSFIICEISLNEIKTNDDKQSAETATIARKAITALLFYWLIDW